MGPTTRHALLATALILTWALPSTAHAQSTVTCDARLRPVAVEPDPSLVRGARVSLRPDGQPVIRYSPMWWQGVSALLRRFTLLHECGYVVAYSDTPTELNRPHTPHEEQLADCFALRRISDEGWTAADLDALRREVALTSGPPDATHVSGAQRAADMASTCRAVAPVTPGAAILRATRSSAPTVLRGPEPPPPVTIPRVVIASPPVRTPRHPTRIYVMPGMYAEERPGSE